MQKKDFQIELITPCFCAGAQPDKQAEIRAPSIRGQLRWWFRTLGGFKSLAPTDVTEQEAWIFGSTSGEEGRAGKLMVRVSAPTNQKLTESTDQQAPNMAEPAGYLLFPLRQQVRKRSALPSFTLTILWRGEEKNWEDIQADIEALVAVFAHLGALGFRSRRAMGALAFDGNPPLGLKEALSHFSSPSAILIKRLPARSATDSITVLGSWLKTCRAHGRSGQNENEKQSPYFKFAKVDHDIGYNIPETRGNAAYRPALGLPIIQRTRNNTNNWEWDWQQRKGVGRFASPIILRPHRDSHGNWHALVIFVDAHKWPTGKQVFLNGQPRAVSLDLYEAMKRDTTLTNIL